MAVRQSWAVSRELRGVICFKFLYIAPRNLVTITIKESVIFHIVSCSLLNEVCLQIHRSFILSTDIMSSMTFISFNADMLSITNAIVCSPVLLTSCIALRMYWARSHDFIGRLDRNYPMGCVKLVVSPQIIKTPA